MTEAQLAPAPSRFARPLIALAAALVGNVVGFVAFLAAVAGDEVTAAAFAIGLAVLWLGAVVLAIIALVKGDHKVPAIAALAVVALPIAFYLLILSLGA